MACCGRGGKPRSLGRDRGDCVRMQPQPEHLAGLLPSGNRAGQAADMAKHPGVDPAGREDLDIELRRDAVPVACGSQAGRIRRGRLSTISAVATTGPVPLRMRATRPRRGSGEVRISQVFVPSRM